MTCVNVAVVHGSEPRRGQTTTSSSLAPRVLLVYLLPAVLLSAFYELSSWRAAGVSGFPLDDAWIHAQFARNLATGHGFTYTGNRWVAGSTSPAWTILLAFGYLITRSVLIAAKVLGVALQLASGVLGARLAGLLTERRDLAIAAGVVVAVSPFMVWGAVSGMELGLASVLVLAGLYVHLDEDPAAARAGTAMLLLALAVLARPETLILLLIVVLHALVRARRSGTFLRTAAMAALIVLAVLGPFVIFDYVTTGKPLPTTFYAKSGSGLFRALSLHDETLLRRVLFVHGPDAVWKFADTLVDQFGIAACLMLAGIPAAFVQPLRKRGAPLIAACILVGAFSMGVVAPMRLKPENFRYAAHLLSLNVVLGVSSLSILWPIVRVRQVRLAVVAAVLAVVCFKSIAGARFYSVSVKNIEELQVTLGKWMHRHLPPGARVAVNDIGALAYFSGREIVDLEGLVSPEALRYPREERGIGFASETKPDYIAIFPFWYPDVSGRPDLFHEVYRVSIAGNVVSAGDTLAVYSTPWTRYPPTPWPAPERRRRWPE